MMNKNNWSNKYFSGNKTSPGKGKSPLRSPGNGNGQDSFRKRPKEEQQKKPPKEKKMSGAVNGRIYLWAR